MILLDIKTIVFSNVITDIVCLVVIIRLWQQSRSRFAGASFFVFDFALQTAALLLIISRGSIPDWMSFVLANTMVIAGALLGYMGLTRFTEKKSSQIHNYILLTAFVFIHAYFTFVQPHQAARNLNLAAGLLIICWQCAWLMLYGVEPGRRQLTRGVGIVFAAYCLVSIIRIVEFFTIAHTKSDYLQSGIFEDLVLISYQMLFILLTYSLMLMFNKFLLIDVETEEEKFSKAFHSSPYAITITRLSDGQIIEVNEGFLKITGYQSEEVQGKTTPALHLWERNDDRDLVVSELVSRGNVLNREHQFRKKSGEVITGLFSADIITINGEKCILSSINDISERKQLEVQARERMAELERTFNALRNSEQEFRTLAEAMPQIVWITRPDGWNIYFNQQWVDYTGMTLEESYGDGWNKPFHPDDQNRAWDAWQNATKNGADYSLECRLRRADGVYKWWLIRGVPLLDNGGNVLKWFGTCTDIDHIKQMEAAVKESGRLHLELVDKLNEAQHVAAIGSWEWNLRTDEVWWSDETYRIFGVTKPDFIPGFKENARFIHPDDVEIYGKSFERCLQTGEPLSFDLRLINPDGRLKHCHAAGQVIFDESGQKSRFIGTVMDITERKRAEEEILKLNAELEQKVNERTRELHESQLALLNLVDDLNQSIKNVTSANRALEEMNKELKAFSYSVSHDLRAPLRSIDGFSLALLEDYEKNLDDTGKNYLTKIRTATQHMGLLIEDMLKLSRISNVEFHHESIDLSKIVQSVAETFQQRNPDDNMKMIIQKDIVIEGDLNSMQIAITNLLENAWKFTGKQKHPSIEFGMTFTEGKKIFFIRDNGVGFDMAYANKLFGAFQRLHSTDEFPGTGIGLATVKRIITRHGGQVWAESEVGKGATFYFTLPE